MKKGNRTEDGNYFESVETPGGGRIVIMGLLPHGNNDDAVISEVLDHLVDAILANSEASGPAKVSDI